MIQNFIKVALRNMLRNKTYSFINIAGLSVGVACCLLLALYIQDEMSYDKHHQGGENIYRVTTMIGGKDGNKHLMGSTSAPIVWGIKDEIPEFETVTRLVNPPGVALNLIKYEDKQFYEPQGFIADSTIFEIFTYPFVEGDASTALAEANTVVISKDMAKKLFGNESALDKVININQGGPAGDYRVTGVIDNTSKSHLQVNFFVSMQSGGWAEYLRSPDVLNEWAGQNFILSYIKLKPGSNPAAVIPKMNTVFQKHGADDLKALGMSKELGLEPVSDIYLYSAYGEQNPRVLYLYVIASIAVFILLIACINFMNLSTAKATKRANEVGLRKTLGAYRSSLIGQFLGEAMVIVVFAILTSVVIVQLVLPLFNQLTSKTISLDSANIAFIFGALAAITLITGLVAGSYPSFYLSSFQPAQVLKGKSSFQNSNSTMRRSLVIFQFVIAITLVCGMLVIGKQLNYIQQKDLGFDQSHKLVIPLRTGDAQNNFTAFRNELSKVSNVNAVTATNYTPGSPVWSDFSLYKKGDNMDKAVMIKNNWVEPNYLDVLNIKLIAGRQLTENRESDARRKIIVNREAAKQLGFTPEQIVGEPLFTEWQGERAEFEVIGVMENFHQVSLKEAVYPLLFRMPSAAVSYPNSIVDLEAASFRQGIADVEAAWKKINPDTPFEFTFLDDNVQKQYVEDKKVSAIITTFTVIAMIISCLGLYGLSTYMAERRFKEIGVRKVMGATVRQIVGMMSFEFLKLVVISFAIAVPVSWYVINKWLDGFAYKISPDAMIFVAAGGGALLIALITVSFESIKAASANPVNSLRNE